ncbi:MAG: histidine kinase dimerization/phosphoacceptor domain-containing protein [Clostridiaceae bacterium]
MNNKNDLLLNRQINELIDKGQKESLCKFIIKYTKKITKSKSVLLCIKSSGEDCEDCDIYYSKTTEDADKDEKIKKQLMKSSMESRDKEIFTIKVNNARYQAINIESLYEGLGILAIESNSLKIKRNLNYLSGFISTVLNELRLRQVKNDLLVNEEKNRIAEEIHDTVCQRLFSLSCASYNLRKNISKLPKDEIENQLMLINESIYKVNNQLRKTMYDLSYKKNGSNIFAEELSLNIKGNEKELHLEEALDGKFEIKTWKGKGTNIKIIFPNENFSKKEEMQAV